MRRTGRARVVWPSWKLRMLLPQAWRHWTELRVVQLHKPDPAAGCWQLQTRLGTPAGVGLFAERQVAVRFARSHCDRVIEEPAEVVA
jgi:hypothetical protein